MSEAAKRTIVRSDDSVRLRPVLAAEAGWIVEAVFAGLSARSRYLRFHAPIPRLTAPLRRRLAELDGRHRAAIVAETLGHPGPTPVGLVQLADLGDGAADVAIAVVDAWQRRGVGRRLLDAAAAHAEALGYRELRGLTLPENDGMRRLVRRALPASRLRRDGDAVALTVPIGPATATVTHSDVLADLLYRGG